MTLSSINSGSFPSSSLSSQQDLLQARAQIKSSPVSPRDVASASDEKRQSALHLVTRTLTQAYDKIATRGVPASAVYNDQEPMTATKAANTILGFIERRLQMDVAEGATQEQLKSRLDAGLEGFKKGFAEAAEQLKALSMLSPEVEADIGDTYKQVTAGVDALRAKFVEGVNNTVPAANKPSPESAIDTPSQINNIAIQQGLYEYAEARDFRFELTTREGDKVSIRASSSFGMSVAAGRDGSGSYVNASKSSASNFALSIEGDLSENELRAINDLLGRVDKLAGQFYAGNLDEVFDKAVGLGYDENQISGYSLNLSQVQIQQVAVSYGAFGPEDASQTPSLANQLAPVGDFIKDFLAALDVADAFSDPQKLLLDLSKKMADKVASENEMPSALTQFLERLLVTDAAQNVKEASEL